MRDFRKLEIWRESKDFCIHIYAIVEKFPQSEGFGLKSQICRAAVSIPSNIAEGCSRSNRSLVQYLNIALGSSFELETQLIIASEIGYISNDSLEKLLNKLHLLQKRMNSFRSNVKER